MFRLVIARHGSTEASKSQRLLGWLDEPLSQEGCAEVHRLGKRLCKLSHRMGQRGTIYSSDLLRAKETASIIADAIGWPINISEGLRERYFGEWTGMSIREIEQEEPELLQKFARDPLSVTPKGGEDISIFQARVFATWGQIIDHPHAKLGSMIITHDGPIRIILRSLAPGEPQAPLFHIRPCSLFWVDAKHLANQSITEL
jgi:broad specificity phosphatase PhoE